jgi:S-formylglutathione hydrolase FrmB
LEELGIKNKLQVMAGKNHGWPGIEDQFGDLLTWFEQQIP